MLKRALLAVLLLALPLAVSVRAGHVNIVASFDGSIDTEFKLGEKPPGDNLPDPWDRCTIDGAVLTSFDGANNTVDFDDGTEEFIVDSISGIVGVNAPLETTDHLDGPCLTIPDGSDAILISRLTSETLSGGTISASGWMVRDTALTGSIYTWFFKNTSNGTRLRERTVADAGADNILPNPHSADVGFNFWQMARIDREEESLRLYSFSGASNPGTNPAVNWEFIRELNYAFLGSGDILAILATSPIDNNDEGDRIVTVWDNVSHDFATELDHSVGTVGFNPATYETDEDTTPLTLTVTRTGGGSGILDLTATFVDGTAEAGIDFTAPTCNFDFANAETGNKTCNVPIINRAEQQGTSQFTVNLTKNSGSDTLQNSTASVTINDVSSGALTWPDESAGANGTLPIATFADWTALLGTDPGYEVVEISNRNWSGAGSLAACVGGTGSADVIRWCIPSVGGKIISPGPGSAISATRRNLVVALQWSPGGGLHIQQAMVNIRAPFQMWIMPSVFTEGTLQANARGFNLNGTQTPLTDIILLNCAAAFSGDGGINVFVNVNRVDILSCMWPYPMPVPGAPVGSLRQSPGLLGDHVGNSNFIQYSRNVATHFTHRSPKLEGSTYAANNISLHGEDAYITIDRIETDNKTFNLRHNLYVQGEVQNGTPGKKPIRFGETSCQWFDFNGPGSGDDDPKTAQIFLEGNDTFGAGMASASGGQTALVEDRCSAPGEPEAEVVGALISAMTPEGADIVDFGPTNANKEEYAAFQCSFAGPYPLSRIGLYQEPCDELQTEFDGGNSGTLPDNVTDYGGFPSVPNSSCNINEPNSCGAGVPAVPPEAERKDADTFRDKMWTATWEAYCARVPAGAPGCP